MQGNISNRRGLIALSPLFVFLCVYLISSIVAQDFYAILGFSLKLFTWSGFLDTFSCLIQGIIPYGAQMLLASGLAGISTMSISSYLYYPIIMGLCAILAILIRRRD